MEFSCNNVQGAFAENVFITESMKRNYNIYRPVVDNHGVDFVIYSDKFYKIQIKSSVCADTRNNSNNSFKICLKRGGNGRTYDKGDFDFCCVYIIPFDTWYIIPGYEIKTKSIRITIGSNRSKFKKYENNWSLLKRDT